MWLNYCGVYETYPSPDAHKGAAFPQETTLHVVRRTWRPLLVLYIPPGDNESLSYQQNILVSINAPVRSWVRRYRSLIKLSNVIIIPHLIFKLR